MHPEERPTSFSPNNIKTEGKFRNQNLLKSSTVLSSQNNDSLTAVSFFKIIEILILNANMANTKQLSVRGPEK